MATLASDVSATQQILGVTDPGTPALRSRHVIDDELVEYVGLFLSDPARWVVNRGVEGTAAASHSAAATVTAFDVTAGGGGDWDDLAADHDAHDHTGVPGVGGGGTSGRIAVNLGGPAGTYFIPADWFVANLESLPFVTLILVSPGGQVVLSGEVDLSGFTGAAGGVFVVLDVTAYGANGVDVASGQIISEAWDGSDDVFTGDAAGMSVDAGLDLSVVDGALLSTAGGVFVIRATVELLVD
jgi:hypothetical protein